jgi:DNA polymerase/3'-5' exonuclease PolX
MKLLQVLKIAEETRSQLLPSCFRVEIAGSVRRRSPEPGDIELVAIPKPYDVGIFESGIATVVNQWQIVKGELPCKYTQRILPEGIKLDLFFATPENWGLIYAIRTGSSLFSKRLAEHWCARGYHSHEGHLYYTGKPVLDCDGVRGAKRIDTPEEEDIFRICGMEWVRPEFRV